MTGRRRWAGYGVACALAIAALAPPAAAFVSRSGQSVAVTEAIQDDLYAAGGRVAVNAPVEGDVVAAGGSVDMGGDVGGGVLAAGGKVTVSGAVGRSVRAAAGSLTLASRVKGDAVLAAGEVHVTPAAQIGRDLVIQGGSVTVSGTVARNAFISGRLVVVDGVIHGSAEIQGNRIVLLPTARIGGKLSYLADVPLEIHQGAQLAGGTAQMAPPSEPAWVRAAPFGSGVRFWKSLVEAAVLLIIGLVAFGASPRGVTTVILQIRRRFVPSLVFGVVLVIAVPVAAVLLLFTVVGIPIAAIAMLVYLATLYPSLAFTAAWAGHGILSLIPRPVQPAPDQWGVVLGVVVLVALFAAPYAGWVIHLLALFVGFGALWATIWRAV
jgi:hypothetical protein